MKEHVKLKHCILSALLCASVLSVSVTSFANDVIVGRYLSVAEKPQNDQQRLLQQQIQIKFPQNILTIKQAVQFILRFSGYSLCSENQLDQPAREMLRQSLPEVDRTFGPMTLEQGLLTLAGNTFYLLLDPVNRMVGFEIKRNYQHLYQGEKVSGLTGQNED